MHNAAAVKRIVLATHNAGKHREFSALLADYPFELVSEATLGVSPVEETGLTFVENALLKARHAAQATGLASLADDSGLVVPALQGAPGIYSARYAGNNANAAANIEKLLDQMQDLPDEQRHAFFYCVIVFMLSATDPAPVICFGRWDGYVLKTPQGSEGFGYDPIFYDPTYQKSAATLPLSIKNKMSHRGKATLCLLQKLSEQ